MAFLVELFCGLYELSTCEALRTVQGTSDVLGSVHGLTTTNTVTIWNICVDVPTVPWNQYEFNAAVCQVVIHIVSFSPFTEDLQCRVLAVHCFITNSPKQWHQTTTMLLPA